MTLDEWLSAQQPRISDAEFGIRVGLSQSQISRLKRGVSRPSWKTMEAIASATGRKVLPTADDWPVKMEAAE